MMPCSSPFPWHNAGYVCHSGLVQASSQAGGGFNDTFTWAALIGFITLATAFVFRWLDKRAKQLGESLEILDKVVVELDTLSEKTAKKDDLKDLKELRSLLKQYERRFKNIPFGTVVVTIETYEKIAITDECAKRLTRLLANKKYVEEALKLSREQGSRSTDIRSAIEDVQHVINRKLRR